MRLTALIIIGAIVLVIFLINLIPVGVDLRYADNVLTVYAKADGKLIQLVPKPEKKPKKEKKSKI